MPELRTAPDGAAAGAPEVAAPFRDTLSALLGALVSGWCLTGTVPLVLEAAERDPLASGGRFAGDLVRGLMEVPGAFWARYPALYARYQSVLRASAVARQRLPAEQRMQFWAPLADLPCPPVADVDD